MSKVEKCQTLIDIYKNGQNFFVVENIVLDEKALIAF